MADEEITCHVILDCPASASRDRLIPGVFRDMRSLLEEDRLPDFTVFCSSALGRRSAVYGYYMGESPD